MAHEITSIEALEALYNQPLSAVTIRKEIDYIHPLYRAFIEASPFCVLATSGPGGMDCTPRGDPAGFVEVADAHTLLLPDRRGNNRLDSMRNILHDPRVGMLFLIPGIGETLRVNGRAAISTDPVLLERFTASGKPPQSVLRITAERVYFHCPKAMIRSQLWDPSRHIPRQALPSIGSIMKAISAGSLGGAEYDATYMDRINASLV